MDLEIPNLINTVGTLSNNEIYLLGRELMKLYWDYNDRIETMLTTPNMQTELKLKGVSLPKKINNLKNFITTFFPSCDEIKINEFVKIYDRVIRKWPIAGIIIINQQREVLLVKNYGSKSWSFPKGKIEPNESSFIAGLRECYEETGLNVFKLAKEKCKLISRINGKQVTFYVIENFPTDFDTPKIMNKWEICDIKWVKLSFEMKTNRKIYNIYINDTYDLLNSYLHGKLRKRRNVKTKKNTPKNTKSSHINTSDTQTNTHIETADTQIIPHIETKNLYTIQQLQLPKTHQTYKLKKEYIPSVWKTPSMENMVYC